MSCVGQVDFAVLLILHGGVYSVADWGQPAVKALIT